MKHARPEPDGAALRVKRLGDSDAQRWDEFVEACPQATFFHRAGWKQVIEGVLGHTACYLYAERDGKLEGVLPLGHIRSRWFGNALISVPFCVYGGAAAVTHAAADALDEAARGLAEDLSVDYLELRNRESRKSGPPAKDLYVTFRKEIEPDPEVNMKAIPRKQRAMVRKGMKAGLTTEIDADVERFYALYSESVRNLGTPVLPLDWYGSIKNVFGDACEVLTVCREKRPVASVMSYYFRDEVLPYYGGGSHEARVFKANDFMYWELMRRAGERGCRIFDYGRSKRGTGSYDFKRNWGFEPLPLHYEYHLVKAKNIPDVNPLNPKYRMLVAMWQRMPLSLSRRIGPYVAKDLG